MLFLLLWLGQGALPASAVHLLGGEMSYKFLDGNGPADKPWRYEVTMRFYFNPLTDPPEQPLLMQVYTGSTSLYGLPLQRIRVSRASVTEITAPTLPGCGQATPRIALGLYVATLELPANTDGYLVVCGTSNRIAGITNLASSVDQGIGLEIRLQPGNIANSSPVFSDIPVALICAGTNSFVSNNAYDPDGDELVYSLSVPSSTFSPVRYATGYSAAQPFGTVGAASVNPVTGISTYLSPAQGIFQILIDVKEYRTINGVRLLLSTSHRDVQVIARTCMASTSQPPVFTPATLAAPQNIQIREGQTVQFNVAATDPDGDPLTLTATSALLDGAGGLDATFNGLPGETIAANPAGSVSVRGVGAVAGTFRLAGCGMGRLLPYDVVITATDEACNRQTVAATYRITVVRPPFSATIRGNTQVCAQSTATYTATSNSGAQPLQWTVVGGEILGPTTGPTVQVLWGKGVGAQVRVSGTTDLGCPTQFVALPVGIGPGLAVQGPMTYCRTAANKLRYTALGPSGTYQWTITDGAIVSGQGTNTVEVDIQPGAMPLLEVSNSYYSQCVTTLHITPGNSCLYFYNVITPNGDRQNDFFVIENIERHPKTALTIFNRWGQKLYHSDDYRNTYDGEAAGAGTYYYLCRLDDGTIYRGWFEVVK
ncbi:gliding motility-associated C-terminal domain-containing protein [Hymenobacter daeguensis]